MVPYRGLFLVVIISLASIVLADVLVQPGYKYQYGNNPQYQSVPQYRNPSPAAQYHAQQLPNQESMSNFVQAQMGYYDKARSYGMRYPHFYPYHHRNYHYHSSRPSYAHHYARIGGHGYTRPSVFVGHPQTQPLIVHWRSRRSVPTSIDSSKSAIVAHDNDVAAKSPLTDDKHPTAIDSLLPENESTDTNDKRVENRQSKNDHVTGPLLLGLYPEKMYPEHREAQSMNTMQYVKSLSIPSKLTCQEKKEASFADPRILTNRPFIRLPPDEEEFRGSSAEEDEGPVELIYYSKYRDASVGSQLAHEMQNAAGNFWPGYYGMYFPQIHTKHVPYNPDIIVINGNLWTAHEENGRIYIQKIGKHMPYVPSKARHNTLQIPYPKESPTTTNALLTPTSVQPQYRNNEELSGTDDMSDTPYFNRIGMPYPESVSFNTGNYPNSYSNYNLNDDSNERQYSNENVYIDLLKRNSAHHIKPSINQIPNYVLYKNISAENNLTPTIPRMQTQFLDTYNYSPENNLQAIPPADYRYRSINPSDTPPYDTSSSSVYY